VKTDLRTIMMMMMKAVPLNSRCVSSGLHNECGRVVSWGLGVGLNRRNVMWRLKPYIVGHVTLVLYGSEQQLHIHGVSKNQTHTINMT